MPEDEKVDQKKPGPKKGISRKEFDELKSSIGEIANILKSQPQVKADSDGVKVVMPQTDKDDGGAQSESMVPPAWRKLTDEILGTDFRITLRLPENGGQIFGVLVPREKSNAGKDYWDRNHRDKRSKELGNTGIVGVKTWLLKIRKNLIGSGIKLVYYEDTDTGTYISTR